jgi:ATP-dependent DNA ligase
MEALLVGVLPREAGWQYEPKWDGFRCLAFRAGDEVEIKAKSGKSLSRFFPEVLENLASGPARYFVLDGELVIPGRRPVLRRPADAAASAESRTRKLADETPAVLVAFDCLLRLPGRPLLASPFEDRRATLEELLAPEPRGPSLTPYTRDVRKAKAWLSRRRLALDGVVAKRLDLPYRPGERAMRKVKCLRTADCVVGGFRYASGRRVVGSLLLGLYDDDGLLHHVGFTSAIPDKMKPEVTARLEKLIQPPGFTGNAPGAPSRWSTERSAEWQPLRPRLVVEVRYDHISKDRFRHGTSLVRWRPDKSPRQCTFDQLPEAAASLTL